MISSAAVMAGARDHGSLRSVRSLICALVLAGASIACVIVDVSALERLGSLRRPRALPLAHGLGAVGEPYSQGISPRWRGAGLCECDSRYTGPSADLHRVSRCRATCAGNRPGAAAGSRLPPPATPCASPRTAAARYAAGRPRAAPMTA